MGNNQFGGTTTLSGVDFQAHTDSQGRKGGAHQRAEEEQGGHASSASNAKISKPRAVVAEDANVGGVGDGGAECVGKGSAFLGVYDVNTPMRV